MKIYTKQQFVADFDEIIEAAIYSGEPVYIVGNGSVVLKLSPVEDRIIDSEAESGVVDGEGDH